MMSGPLSGGDRLPSLTVTTIDHGEQQWPECFEQPLNLVLFYRGHW
ncbi:MAG: hypothetical protein QNL18_07670 [Pseudomonadales bacterium]|jgi:hypothetical protein